MNERSNRWAAVLAVVFVAAVVGYGACTIFGLSHGLAVNGSLTAAAAPVPGAAPIVVYPYGWHRPWGFGFFPFFRPRVLVRGRASILLARTLARSPLARGGV